MARRVRNIVNDTGGDPPSTSGAFEQPEQAQLRPVLERLSFVLSSTGLGVWERDLTTDRVTWSESMYRLFGRTTEHFSGSPDQVLSFVHPEDRVPFRDAYRAAIDSQSDSFEQEYRIIRSDGEIRWVHRRGQVRRGPDGKARSVLGVAMDITERKQAEALNARLAAIIGYHRPDPAVGGKSVDDALLKHRIRVAFASANVDAVRASLSIRADKNVDAGALQLVAFGHFV